MSVQPAGDGAVTPWDLVVPDGHLANVIALGARTPSGAYVSLVKPALDRCVALVLLVLLAPLMAVTALVVAAEFGRPVLFRQQRVGRGGATFSVLKFRTMQQDRRCRPAPVIVEQDRRRTHKSDADPRHTQVGRALRRLSLDELPQLFNVLRGEMSLVGPRPELVELVARYQPWQQRRHDVKPGVTGLWQVSARSHGPMHELTHVDLEYVDGLSWRNDLRILLATPRAVLHSQRGS